MKISLIFLLCFGTCLAFSQTKEDSVKELLKVMNQEELMDKTFNSVMPAMQQQIQKQVGVAQSKSMEEFLNYTITLASAMSKRLFNEDLLPIYSNLFTQTEIQDMIIFYKTPTGKKTLEVMPEMQKQLMNIMYTKYMPEIQEKLKQKALELKPKTSPTTPK
jgi:hypothetical protein